MMGFTGSRLLSLPYPASPGGPGSSDHIYRTVIRACNPFSTCGKRAALWRGAYKAARPGGRPGGAGEVRKRAAGAPGTEHR
ncbi:hypothetical protein GCM10023196_068970 [Actinoallomurus vinaceus]|uniref:Uncharacterized protein n=1 Tax=Actinoallomurus vinaceus TaxID=1080074 RepID=A0ABP8UJ89_9ACTN